MRYEVLLTEGAERDLEAIHDYIVGFDRVANANYVLDQLIEVVEREPVAVPGAWQLPEGAGGTGNQGIPAGVIQALPGDLSGHR